MITEGLDQVLEGLDRERETVRGCVRDLQRAGDVPALNPPQLLLSFAAMEISRAMRTVEEAIRMIRDAEAALEVGQ